MRRPPDARQRVCRASAILAALMGAATLAVQPVAAAPPPDCTVTPRPASEFVLPTEPNAAANAGRSLLIVDNEAQLPTGIPAASADVAAAQAFADLYTACQNSGDLRRITALYTDAMFQDSLAMRLPIRLPPENPFQALLTLLFDSTARDRAEAATYLAQDLAAPLPLSHPIANAEVRDVRVLSDGRLGAVLVQDSRPTEFQIYARVDGRLLLDERMNLR